MLQFTMAEVNTYALIVYVVSAVTVGLVLIINLDEGRRIYDRVIEKTHDFDWQTMDESNKQLGLTITSCLFMLLPLVNTFFALTILKELAQYGYELLHEKIFGVDEKRRARIQADAAKKLDKIAKGKYHELNDD